MIKKMTRPWLLLTVLMALPWSLSGIERKPLPSFPIVALDGRDTSSDTLITEGKWLLVYVQPGCTPCDTLLRAIDPAQQPGLPQRMIVVVGGADAAAAAGMAAGYGKLAGSRWYADPKRTMGKSLPIAGAPVVFGLKGKMLEWSRAGLTPSMASVKSAMTSWANAH